MLRLQAFDEHKAYPCVTGTEQAVVDALRKGGYSAVWSCSTVYTTAPADVIKRIILGGK